MGRPHITNRYVHWEGMTWPHVASEDTEDSIEWKLRYGNPTKIDLLYAASIIAAYGSLIRCTEKKRREVITMIRAVKPHKSGGE